MQKLNKQFYSYYDGAMHKNIVWTGVVEGDHDIDSCSCFCFWFLHDVQQP